MKRYIAKKGEWFKEGTEAKLVCAETEDSALFRGMRVCENPPSEGKWRKIGEEYMDEEMCTFDEFIITEEK